MYEKGKLFQTSSTELRTAEASPNIKFLEFLKEVGIPSYSTHEFAIIQGCKSIFIHHISTPWINLLKKKGSAITPLEFYLTLKVYRMTWQVCCCCFITSSIACISYSGSAAVVAVVLIFSGNFEMGRLNNFPDTEHWHETPNRGAPAIEAIVCCWG